MVHASRQAAASSGSSGACSVLGVTLMRGTMRGASTSTSTSTSSSLSSSSPASSDELQALQGVLKVSLRAMRRGLETWAEEAGDDLRRSDGSAGEATANSNGGGHLTHEEGPLDMPGIAPLIAWTSLEALRTGCWFQSEVPGGPAVSPRVQPN